MYREGAAIQYSLLLVSTMYIELTEYVGDYNSMSYFNWLSTNDMKLIIIL